MAKTVVDIKSKTKSKSASKGAAGGTDDGAPRKGPGLRIERRFTAEGLSPYDTVQWSKRDSRITNPDGSVVFEMKDAEIPSAWSQVAADIMVSKYFRKAGVPVLDKKGNPTFDDAGKMITGSETSARQVIARLAETWRWWGEEHGYFADEESAQIFEDEIAYMLLHQMAAPNSPQWFNTGLHHKYGITGTAEGFWYVDPDTEEMVASPDSYSRPAPHACFPAGTKITVEGGTKAIETVEAGDSVLTHEGRYRKVTDTMARRVDEPLVRLNLLHRVPGRSLGRVVPKPLVATENHPILAFRKAVADGSDGSSVLKPEWIDAGKLEVGDVAVLPATASGAPRVGEYSIAGIGGIRRVAHSGMVYNLQVEEDESYVADGVVVHNCFIQSIDDDLVNPGGIMDLWVREARLFKFGSGTGTNFSNIRAVGEKLSGGGTSSGLMSFLRVGDRAAGAIRSGGTTRRAAKMVIVDADHPDIEAFIHWKAEEENKVKALIAAGYPSDFNGEAYATVSCQNSTNSVRLSNEFIEAVLEDREWHLTARTDGSVMKTVQARDLWHQIADAAWQCADPGVQFDTTIQEWHTSPAGGKIRATNPCSEYVFLDNTACNLASLNLVKFYDADTGTVDLDAYRHATRLWTMVLEISVTMAQFPSAEIAQGSYDYRTLGLGYANLGSLLMQMGIPYDSDEGRGIAGALTAILTGYAYATSAEMAEALGPFAKYEENAAAMLRVMRNHRKAAYNAGDGEFEGVSTHVMGIAPDVTPSDMLHEAQNAWNIAVKTGEQFGYRNAQATVLAPTGTIGLLMDCDTTGVEPDFALVKFKKLAGGGYFKIANQSIEPALRNLGYTEGQIEQIIDYVVGAMSLHRAPHINTASLIAKGLTIEDLNKIEAILPGVFELGFAFNQWTLGERTLQRLGFTPAQYNSPSFDMLRELGYSAQDVEEANDYVCGRQTIEGAPGLLEEHLPVFDCANRNGKLGERFIHYTGHIKMMAAAQPFISGAISKCVVGSTLLATADGLVRIESLHQGESPDSFRDEVMEVASINGPQKTDAFYYGGERPVRTATLRSGHRVTATPNHRLLTAADGDLVWRRLDEIQPGEYVATHYGSDIWATVPARFDSFVASAAYGNQKSVRMPEEMTPELGFLLGAYVAEGHTSRSNWTITITNADEGVLARVAAAWQSEFDVDARIARYEGKCPGVVVASKEIVEFFDHLGCGERAATKRIPDAVLRSPKPVVLAFLQGLFLDGYVSVDATLDRMALCVDSTGLLDDLQAVLTNLGVVHSRISKHNTEYDKDFDEVYAAGREAQKLARLVPFAEADKRARQDELLDRSYAQSTADVVPGITPRELYELIPAGKSGRNGYGVRSEFAFLCDPRTKHVSRRTLERIAMIADDVLPEWLLTVVRDRLHFSPVIGVEDAGTQEVYDVSVPTNHAFVGNGIVNHNTINMPNEVSIEDIEESYRMSWELGLKAMALYRDGSKASQPLSATSEEGTSDEEEEAIEEALVVEQQIHGGMVHPGISPTEAYSNLPRPRFLLPGRRDGFTQEARIGGHKLFMRTGEYEDGTLGELFLDLAKEGATLRGILSCFAIAVSKGLQYGVPLEEYVDTFTFQTFEPRGIVEGHPNIKMANSIVDYVFRALGVEYLHRDELAQVPPERVGLPEPPKGAAVDTGYQPELVEAIMEDDIDAQKAAAAFVDQVVDLRDGDSPTVVRNGTLEAAPAPRPDGPGTMAAMTATGVQTAAIQAVLADKMGDAPLCDTCGHITVRNGSCYRCLNCGDSKGCS